jgi:hypothetical protein
LIAVEEGKWQGNGESEYCGHMYVNGKMRPTETIPGMGKEGVKQSIGGGKFKYDIIDVL